MDALARADEALARARARAHVVTPEDATSPMDAAATVQIPRRLIAAVDPRQDTESTMIIARGAIMPTEGWGPSPR
ncbi:MAG TPA: hypothetical protein VGD67_16215 [Pseudonocardiaceae bacterium]